MILPSRFITHTWLNATVLLAASLTPLLCFPFRIHRVLDAMPLNLQSNAPVYARSRSSCLISMRKQIPSLLSAYAVVAHPDLSIQIPSWTIHL